MSSYTVESLTITFNGVISNKLSGLISVQRNLKHLIILVYYNCEYLAEIISSLTNLSNTLIKLDIDIDLDIENHLPLSFISKFTNLQEFVLSFNYHDEYFKHLQHVTFPQ